MRILIFTLFLAVGCSVSPALLVEVPEPGARSFAVQEFMLVEQSVDNPDHPGFAERAIAVVGEKRADWFTSSAGGASQKLNDILAQFDRRMLANTNPPYSGYALYHQDRLIQDEIARFWPVAMTSSNGQVSDFILPFETFSGELRLASRSGITAWAVQASQPQPNAAVRNREPLAMAAAGLNLYAQAPVQLAASQFDLPDPVVSADVFRSFYGGDTLIYRQQIGQEEFILFNGDGLVHEYYGGRNLNYIYDQVVYGQAGQLAVFNPGGTGDTAWFFALRDGVWYYVEVGLSR